MESVCRMAERWLLNDTIQINWCQKMNSNFENITSNHRNDMINVEVNFVVKLNVWPLRNLQNVVIKCV